MHSFIFVKVFEYKKGPFLKLYSFGERYREELRTEYTHLFFVKVFEDP